MLTLPHRSAPIPMRDHLPAVSPTRELGLGHHASRALDADASRQSYLNDNAQLIHPKLVQLSELIRDIDDAYHRLALIVGARQSGKTALALAMAAQHGTSVLNVNLTLSSLLLDLTSRRRALDAAQLLEDSIPDLPGLIVMDNLEILFDVSLALDPLRLLQGISRNRLVIATWSGKLVDDQLTYAEPGHHEYRSYPTSGLAALYLERT